MIEVRRSFGRMTSLRPTRRGAAALAFALLLGLLALAPAPGAAFVVKPTGDGLISVTLNVTADSVDAAREEASLSAVRACVGRVFWGNQLLSARGLLDNYLAKSHARFVRAIETLATDFVAGRPNLQLRVFVDYNALEADLREKRFLFEPKIRPHFIVFLEEKLGEDFARYETGRDAIAAALQDRNLRPFGGVIDRPPRNANVIADPILREDALVACERREIEILVSGSSQTHRDSVKDIYYDTYFFYTTDMDIALLRVDTGEELARVKARGSAAHGEEQQAINLSIQRAASQAAARLADLYDKIWPFMVQNRADYRILFTGATPENLNLLRNTLEKTGRDAKVYLRQTYDRSAVFTLSYSGGRQDVINALATNAYPTLSLVPPPALTAEMEVVSQTQLREKLDVANVARKPGEATVKPIFTYRYATQIELRLRDIKTRQVVLTVKGEGEATDLVQVDAAFASWRQALGVAFVRLGEQFPARYDELEVLSARYSVRLAKSDRDLVAPLSEAFRLHSPLARVTGRTSGEPVIQMQFTSTSGEPNLLGQDPLLPDARISVSPRSNWLEVQVGQ